MNWFRRNVRQGASFALIALALNILLSFGHVHAPALASDSALVATIAHGNAPGSSDNDVGDQRDDLCPICLALAAIASGAVAHPPAPAVDLSFVAVDHPVDAARTVVQTWRTGFRSRAPPSFLTSFA